MGGDACSADVPPVLDAWLRTLTNTVGTLLRQGGIPEGFTWSGVANPFIWATASLAGRQHLRAALDQLGVGHRSADMLSDWWEGRGVRTARGAATWISAHSGRRRGAGPRVPPYRYISAELQEYILTEAGVSWMIQLEMVRADADHDAQWALGTLVPSSNSEFSSDEEHSCESARDDGGRNDGSVEEEQATLVAAALENCLLRLDPATRTVTAMCIFPWLLLPCHARSILLTTAVRLRICVPTLRRVTRWLDDQGVDTPARLCAWVTNTGGDLIAPYSPLPVCLANALYRDADLLQPIRDALDRTRQLAHDGHDRGASYDGNGCPICRSAFEGDEHPWPGGCRHRYHEECLSRWIAGRLGANAVPCCPVCRLPADSAGEGSVAGGAPREELPVDAGLDARPPPPALPDTPPCDTDAPMWDGKPPTPADPQVEAPAHDPPAISPPAGLEPQDADQDVPLARQEDYAWMFAVLSDITWPGGASVTPPPHRLLRSVLRTYARWPSSVPARTSFLEPRGETACTPWLCWPTGAASSARRRGFAGTTRAACR